MGLATKTRPNYSVRLGDKEHAYALNIEDNLSAGVNTALYILQTLEDEAMSALRGYFQPNEWKFLVYILKLNPPRYEQRCRPDEIANCVQMARCRSQYRVKFGVNCLEIDKKINALTSVEVFALIRRIDAFWSQVEGLGENYIKDDLEEFAEF